METVYFNSKDAEEFRFLSNFYRSPFFIDFMLWDTVEHYYQASKAKNEADRLKIWRTKTPGEAKKLGKTVEIKDDWDDLKDGVMLEAVREKFRQNEGLREMLLATDGFELVEFAPWGDTYWGVDKDKQGKNRLGKILMHVREEFKRKL